MSVVLIISYLDNVVPGEHGNSKPFYYFLLPSYWGCSKPTLDDVEYVMDDEIGTNIQNEHNRAINNINAPVRIMSLSKTYKNVFDCGKKEVKAVDNVSLCIENSEIFCLLGHNGAGKTTTINMLIGLFKPSSGNAYIYGNSIMDNMDNIRRKLGVCPQHDILWDKMTALEHLELFSVIKGLSFSSISNESSSKLDYMGLTDVYNILG